MRTYTRTHTHRRKWDATIRRLHTNSNEPAIITHTHTHTHIHTHTHTRTHTRTHTHRGKRRNYPSIGLEFKRASHHAWTCARRHVSYLPRRWYLQHTATRCNTLQHTAAKCTIWACTMSTRCSTLHHTASHYNNCNKCITLQHTATHCNTLQHTATHCYTLQHTATHCNKLAFMRCRLTCNNSVCQPCVLIWALCSNYYVFLICVSPVLSYEPCVCIYMLAMCIDMSPVY